MAKRRDMTVAQRRRGCYYIVQGGGPLLRFTSKTSAQKEAAERAASRPRASKLIHVAMACPAFACWKDSKGKRRCSPYKKVLKKWGENPGFQS